MKILELTNFSSGICGVWNRVKEESIRLAKNNEVLVISSNITKGINEIAKESESLNNITIKRVKAKIMPFGESFMLWDYKKAEQIALAFKPDLIICHSYRHNHTLFALKLKKQLKCKVFLVTHAPFIEKNETRTKLGKLATTAYDLIIGPNTLNDFDKIITITNWENKYLEKLKVKKEKIVCIPNGIPEEFFKQKLNKKDNKTKEKTILFIGRIAQIKNLEVVIKSIPYIKNKNINFEIVGPSEEGYLKKLKQLIKSLKIENRVIFSKPVYNIEEKIKKIDSSQMFILPSIRESMPQSLIEAMAREKLVLASINPGNNELIRNKENGFLFNKQNSLELADIINSIDNKTINQKTQNFIKINARKSVTRFSWNKIEEKLNELIKIN